MKFAFSGNSLPLLTAYFACPSQDVAAGDASGGNVHAHARVRTIIAIVLDLAGMIATTDAPRARREREPGPAAVQGISRRLRDREL